MGPPLISGGRGLVTLPASLRQTHASMGPPLISGGRDEKFVTRKCQQSRFNGASADQRRKAAISTCWPTSAAIASMGPPLISGGRISRNDGTERRRERFNGASADQRRKAAVPGSSLMMSTGFNGASADQRRKAAPGDRGRHHAQGASMGPPLISGGRDCPSVDCIVCLRRFNGASADQRRKGRSHSPCQLD